MTGTPDLFSCGDTPAGKVDLVDAALEYLPEFFDEDRQRILYEKLISELDWSQGQIKLYGREHTIPRLEAWHGDPGARYGYSGTELEPQPWTPALQEIREALISHRSDLNFNSVLGNWYRDGEDAMGWHSDDEKELGPEPVIASISLGDERRFLLRHRRRKELQTHEITLESGSLLLMRGESQRAWRHSIPKTRRTVAPRINLTYRHIMPANGSIDAD